MRRMVVLIAGLAAGVVLAGVAAPAVMLILPPEWRGEPVVWATALIVVALTVGVLWALFASDPSKPPSGRGDVASR